MLESGWVKISSFCISFSFNFRPHSPALAPARPQSPSMSHGSLHSPLGYSAASALGFSTPPPPGFGGLPSFAPPSTSSSSNNSSANTSPANLSYSSASASNSNNSLRPQSPSLLQGANPHLAAAGRPQSPGARAFTPGGTPGNPIAAPSRGSSLANEQQQQQPLKRPGSAASVVANGIARSRSPQVQVKSRI